MNSLLHRWLRWRYPKSMKHMADLHPRFRIVADNSGRQIVQWRNRSVADLQPLSPLRGSQQGRSCFVLAAGPSLAEVDLAAVSGHSLFGVNGAVAKTVAAGRYERHRLTHYVITDRDFVEHRLGLVQAVFAAQPHVFLSAQAMSAICERDAQLLARAPVSLIETHFCPYGKPRLTPAQIEALTAATPTLYASSWRIGFSRDIEIALFSAHTVVFYAVQIAAYLGFRSIFMLGTDFGSDGAQVRFYEQRGGPFSRTARPSRMEKDFEKFIRPGFEAMQRACADDPGLQVYNLSPRSRLPESIIPRLTLDEAVRMAAR